MADDGAMLRLAVFAASFCLFAVLEVLFPRRKLHYPKSRRWFANLGLSVINTVVLRLATPLAGTAIAIVAAASGWGLLNNVTVSPWLGIALFLVLFDLAIYWQHRLFHAVPWLWRLHRLHHTDPDYDLTTGNRFHPGEMLLSALIKGLVIIVLGPPVLAVVLAEVILNTSSLFNHSNLRLPAGLDAVLRRAIVTPDMHRVHHSVDRVEHDRNFGFCLSLWDRWFGSYREAPAAGQEGMEIGLRGFQDPRAYSLGAMLVQPLRENRD